MLNPNLALTSEVTDVTARELNRVAAALQKQILRDFRPAWGVEAAISAFTDVSDVPVDYWIVMVCYDVPEGLGNHIDANGRPAAFVEWSDDWSFQASHEVLEMLADPWGKRLIAGESIKPGQGRVEYLLEVCDPCQAPSNGYTVNGERVSDFFMPSYFDPLRADGVRYSFSGNITAPRQILPGGYLSWFDEPTGEWWQCDRYGRRPAFRNLGTFPPAANFRACVDAVSHGKAVDRRTTAAKKAQRQRAVAPTSKRGRAATARQRRRE
jgi:hypothetical protein